MPENDPIVAGVRQMVAIVRSKNVLLADAAVRANVPLEIVAELAAIAFEERLVPSNALVSPVMLRHETIERGLL
jgi:hypothetical protein